MAQKTENMQEEFKEIEKRWEQKAQSDALLIDAQNKYIDHLKKTILEKDETQNQSAAIIRACKAEITSLQQKIVRDSNMIESLQRFILTLETKINYQAELLSSTKARLEELQKTF